MINKDKLQKIATWSTKKVDGGFRARAYTLKHQGDLVLHFDHTFKTRARATRYAKECKLYLNRLIGE